MKRKLKQKQYPQQTGEYIVKVKTEQSTCNWQGFPTARLQISVGQEYHEGSKLQALADWVAPRFTRAKVCVDDTLQRFNLMFEKNIGMEAARIIADHAGLSWIERNWKTLSALPQVEIVRWDSWLAHPSYHHNYSQIEALYAHNASFKDAIDSTILGFWERRKEMKPSLYTEDSKGKFSMLSRAYLLEEIAASCAMFEEEGAIDIYPGSIVFTLPIFRTLPEGAPENFNKGHFCRVGFSRNKVITQNNEPKAFTIL